MKKRKVKKHWYKITVIACPVCGSETVYRERVYGRKPKKYWSCHEYLEHWDYCNAL